MRNMVTDNLGFKDNETHNHIMCAFSLDEVCQPECAACNVQGVDPKAECQRGPGESFYIGRVIG